MKKVKKKPTKKNKNEKVCERCGNGGFTPKKVFRCKYCGFLNGLDLEGTGHQIEITRGGLDEY